MPDSFLLLAPVLLLPIVAVLRFVGCLLKPEFQGNLSDFAVNCGGPEDFDGGVAYFGDDGGDHDFFDVSGGQPLKLQSSTVTDANGNSVSAVYGTCRTGSDITYSFRLATGSYKMTLRFAEIGTAQNAGDRVFSFAVDNGAGSTFSLPDGSNSAYDIIAKAGERLISRDEQLEVVAVGGKQMKVRFQNGSGSPLINAIQCSPYSEVTITPGSAPIIEGQAQQFSATASWDPAAEITWSVAGPGQIASATGLFTAPLSVSAKTPTLVQATAFFEGQPVTATAPVSIYPHRDSGAQGGEQGNWLGRYGSDGYVFANIPENSIPASLPPYAGQFAATRLDGTVLHVFRFLNSFNDPRCLRKPDGSRRDCIVWDDPSSLPNNGMPGFTLSFDFLDSQPHLFGIYFVDLDGATPARDQTITVLNADNNAVLAQDQLQAFTGGVYLLWVFTGRIKIQVRPNVRNAVAAALFFG